MKNIIIWLVAALFAVSGCRSVKTTSTVITQKKDSTTYSNIQTVRLDTIITERDTAVVTAILATDSGNNLVIEQITQKQDDGVRIDYTIEKTAEGKTKVTVKAVTPEKETVIPSFEKEIIKDKVVSDSIVLEKEKIVKKGFNWWNLTWIVPVLLVVLFFYLKKKGYLKFLPF